MDPSWTITARGQQILAARRATVSPHALSLKSLVYSDKRILYPMKRVDFDPNGERNPQNRGISGYERISWDEALDIVAGEIRRMKKDARSRGDRAWPRVRTTSGAISTTT